MPRSLYAVSKYTLYALLLVDCWWFMREDFAAAKLLLTVDTDWRAFGATLAQTLDTWAWLGLLALFELETSVLPRALLRGWRKWSLHGLRAVCYVFVVYACHGYVTKLAMLGSTTSLASGASLCVYADGQNAFVASLDDYVLLDETNCAALTRSEALTRVAGTPLLGYAAEIEAARRLALTDVANSVAWILVAVVLELEVLLQLAGLYPRWLEVTNYGVKALLYTTLAGPAVYWGFAGTFLDFRDAGLWIAAFLFIELNLFRWGEAGSGTKRRVSARSTVGA